jgi:hypothetical protein
MPNQQAVENNESISVPLEKERSGHTIYIVMEIGRKTKLLKAFKDEEQAKRFMQESKENNDGFANPPMVLVRGVDLM